MKKTVFLALSLMSIGMNISASGVSLGATRVVFPTDKEQVTIKTYNTDPKGSYLIQSWVSNENGEKVDDFIVTPPLYVQKPNSDNVLRIVYAGNKATLPTDREKVYYFNSKVIPSLSKEQQMVSNALLIATTTNIKLFMRPSNLTESSLDAYKKISCNFNNQFITVKNNSPFYMSLTSLKSNAIEISTGIMVPPFGTQDIPTKNKVNSMQYSFINDYGVRSEELNCLAD